MSVVCQYNDCNQFEKMVPMKNTKIQLPKKQKIYKQAKPIEIKPTDNLSYEINKNPTCFDPNTTNSPSTVFIHNLTSRMNEYYSESILHANNSHRDRANSMDTFMRKRE
jgi:hypothetical protein